MAISVTAQITGQEIVSTGSYCYMYEPLKINISESDANARTISIDVDVYNADDNTLEESFSEYGKFDINVGQSVEVDLMRLCQQHFDANVFKLGVLSDIANAKDIPVSKYTYSFKIYSDTTATQTIVKKIPIIGGRDFYDFVPTVSNTQVLTEADLYNVDLTGRWKNYPNISVSLKSISASDLTPTISVTTETSANSEPCGGMLIWKSRFGGWMYWGMDISTKSLSSKYSGGLTVGMFEATSGGNPYVEVDYTKIDTSYSVTLKALSLTSEELEAVAGINSSVAVYYMKNSSAKLELMRVTSASAPISNLIGGGDFSVSLKSISTSSQKSR